ncbi:TonB-dependent receptor domain-containing protein [Microbulbifer halophilus]|uniref:TonB-dependent receptor domain-containing protein n=1 Tax=Microbulbifer halophilus TaxID=453963 RepID=A0ABW5EBI3_9GAMM|nr:TonB-dependent receptor [Microbulbifer halophilus]MCW8126008.1 TonB-dependent receptor [Microbulbifer halophilus]
MIKIDKFQRAPLVVAVAAASSMAPQVWAQVEMEDVSGPSSQQIEEVMVQGRLRDSAEMLIDERLDEEVVTDVLGSEMIGRVGDSTVAAALRRVSGLSLVNDKFVYVRGLGERYSSTTLNGATVPSPDLTRNVIPLDIFPTSVVDSLAVQKSYSADQAATFGGGNVDIRTKGIPDQLTYSIEMGSGFNSETSGDVLSYKGGGDDAFGTDDGTRAMPSELQAALQRFQGGLGVNDIRETLLAEGNEYGSPQEEIAAAEALNRELALNLNRDISIKEESSDPDYNFKGSVGNRFYIGDDWELGFLAGSSYQTKWREEETFKRSYGFPEERTDNRDRSTYSVDISGNLNLGLRYAGEHEISTTSLYLRNTDDETSVRDYFNENRQISDGRGFREYTIRYEERDLRVHQVKGSHSIGPATKALFDGLLDWVPEELVVDWQYSDSTAATSIPNEISINADTMTDTNGLVESSSVSIGVNSAGFRFTDLDDEVINYGWSATLPLHFSTSTLELSGGFARTEKGRTYRETQFRLGALDVADPDSLVGDLDEVFGDEPITNPDNDFVFDRAGADNQSYIAATLTEAAFGKVDWTFNETWRVAAGARWEDYSQVALDWNPYGYSVDDPQIPMDPDELADATFAEDKVYPSLSLTYMGSLWAETFQLRFGASKTAVRPDLREITDAIYIDPITDEQIKGNPDARPSEITNFDVRAEWFFDNGDNLTVSAYYKDIADPIEFFELASSDTNVAREIINAESGEITGMEIEGMKTMGFLGETMDSFFLQGNVTMQDSELLAGSRADAPTNPEREMTGASDYVVNMLVGFDSPDGNHSATLGYNVFGERLYLAGRNGAPDAFEQPFHSLDLTYSWYPTDEVTLKAKMQNLLDEAIEIERSGVAVFEEKPGSTFALSAQYQF